MFAEFLRAIHTAMVNGVPTVTSYATANYLDCYTIGEASRPACPDKRLLMDAVKPIARSLSSRKLECFNDGIS